MIGRYYIDQISFLFPQTISEKYRKRHVPPKREYWYIIILCLYFVYCYFCYRGISIYYVYPTLEPVTFGHCGIFFTLSSSISHQSDRSIGEITVILYERPRSPFNNDMNFRTRYEFCFKTSVECSAPRDNHYYILYHILYIFIWKGNLFCFLFFFFHYNYGKFINLL